MTHRPALPLRQAHLHTIWANLTRKPPALAITRERLELPDGDFLDLDWLAVAPRRSLVILSHGLEGHSRRPYMLGMASALARVGFDVLAWSYRGCSGQLNRLARLYHCGCDDDLAHVVRHALARRPYDRVHLVGFSMGGNLTLLYAGRGADALDARVRSVVAVSAPCDLNDSIRCFERGVGRLYSEHFLISLRQKVRAKAAQHPALISARGLRQVRSLRAFDDAYTAPLHGFQDAVDYWTRCSARPWLERQRVPGLILNALDDPFLTGGCYPRDEVAQNPALELMTPAHGGHVGFLHPGRPELTWAEHQVMRYLQRQDTSGGA